MTTTKATTNVHHDDDDHDDTTTDETIHFYVEGMMCQKNCGTTVQNAIQSIMSSISTSSSSVEVSFLESSATIRYNTNSPTKEQRKEIIELIINEIDDVGFDATYVSYMIHLHVDGMMCQKNCGTTVTNAMLGHELNATQKNHSCWCIFQGIQSMDNDLR
mmetsp:Transcript_2469/g.6627  ORF Transcript_2469/g.6627 Transcript_2469/m.6627 type:complete len:160 (-) Transcript_2469:1828-2307(-)